MSARIERLQQAIEPLRQEIIHHKVYSVIKDVDDFKIFMQSHVFAVWDFMSLLKSLQNALTCTSVPWFPKGNAETRFLINEIVVGEESDIDLKGNRISHFELYLQAMKQCGAGISQIETFISILKNTSDFQTAFKQANVSGSVKDFVDFTFEIINSNKPYLQSAIFTFGREDLIPGMFLSIINDIDDNFPNSVSIFKYYLERHIEVDGDHHSNLALQMTETLCGYNDTYWQEAEQATIKCLQKRIALWDGIHEKIVAKTQIAMNV